MEEIWKHIPGYEGLYEASTLGRIRSVERWYVCGNYHNLKKTGGFVMKPYKMKDGYLHISLSKNGKPKCFLVHRLVAITFIPNPNNYPEVNHKNEIRDCNVVSNLEWCESSYNSNYGNRNKKHSVKASKPVRQYDLQGNFIAEYYGVSEASRQTGIALSTIGSCCRGSKNRKTAGGFKWYYGSSTSSPDSSGV